MTKTKKRKIRKKNLRKKGGTIKQYLRELAEDEWHSAADAIRNQHTLIENLEQGSSEETEAIKKLQELEDDVTTKKSNAEKVGVVTKTLTHKKNMFKFPEKKCNFCGSTIDVGKPIFCAENKIFNSNKCRHMYLFPDISWKKSEIGSLNITKSEINNNYITQIIPSKDNLTRFISDTEGLNLFGFLFDLDGKNRINIVNIPKWVKNTKLKKGMLLKKIWIIDKKFSNYYIDLIDLKIDEIIDIFNMLRENDDDHLIMLSFSN